MTLLEASQLKKDLIFMRTLLRDFCQARSPEDWQQHTEPNQKGWTLRETIAHLNVVALSYNQGIEAALSGQEANYLESISKREDLASFNEKYIRAQDDTPIADIYDSFLAHLQQSIETVTELSPADLQRIVDFPAYNRPVSVAQLLAAQIAHPGLIHAAQLANGAHIPYLWKQYDSNMLYRMISYSIQLFSLVYWPQRGKFKNDSIHFVIKGKRSAGQWYVTLRPDGGEAGEGEGVNPILTIRYRRAETFCEMLTAQIDPIKATLTGKILIWGNLSVARRLPYYFMPA